MRIVLCLLLFISIAHTQSRLKISVESSSSDEARPVANLFMSAVREAIGQNQTLQYEWTSDSANITISFIFVTMVPVNNYGQTKEDLRVVACSGMLFYCIPSLGFKAGQTHAAYIFSAKRFDIEKAFHAASVIELISQWASSYGDWARAWQANRR